MHTLTLLLLIGACVCFALAIPSKARINLVAAGLLLAYLVPLIHAVRTTG